MRKIRCIYKIPFCEGSFNAQLRSAVPARPAIPPDHEFVCHDRIGGQQMALITLSLMEQPFGPVSASACLGRGGVAKLPNNLSGVLAGPLGGRIAQIRNGRTPGMCSASMLTAAWVVLFFLHGSLTWVIGCAAASTAGLTIMYVATPAIGTGGVQAGHRFRRDYLLARVDAGDRSTAQQRGRR